MSNIYKVRGSLTVGYEYLVRADSEKEAMELAGYSSGDLPEDFDKWNETDRDGYELWQVMEAEKVSEKEVLAGPLWDFLDNKKDGGE